MTDLLGATDPRGELPPYEFKAYSALEVEDIAADLRAGQSEWASLPVPARMGVLLAWADSIAANRKEIQKAVEADTGRRLIAATEVGACIRRIRYWCEKAPQILSADSRGRSASAPAVRYQHVYVPYELVGVISPWNFPLLLTLTDVVPALAAGCAVIAKPSEITPRFAGPLQNCIDSIPQLAAVFKLVTGAGATGEALVNNVDAVCFTGSVNTGKKVGAQSGGRIIPAFLELGGNDALVVLDDADIDMAVNVALRASCISTGQACQSIERVYIHDSLHEAFVSRLVNEAAAVRITSEKIDRGILGPFIDRRQADKVRAHIEDAVARGARQHCGEFIENGGGVWLTPVVLTDVDHSMNVMNEETFGPVIPVMAFTDDDQAVALANDTTFGLSAAVIGADENRAVSVAARLNAGAVSVNDAGLTTMVSDVEKDSFGQSGMGRSRMGVSGLKRFLRSRAILIQDESPAPITFFAEQESQNENL